MAILFNEIDIGGTSFPVVDLKAGRLYYRTDLSALFGYDGTQWSPITAGTLLRENITPTGSVNGSNLTYTLPETFNAGSLIVTRNGLVLKNGVDFFESSSLPGFTTTAAPLTNDTLLSFYTLTPTTMIPNRVVQVATATAGQTVFTTQSYTPGTGGLEVYSSGLRQILTTDYAETSTSSITFTSGRQVGELIVFVSTVVAVGGGGTGNGITAGTVFPTTGLSYGSAFYRTDLQALFLYNGTTWAGIGYGSFEVNNAVPTGATDGVNITYTLTSNFQTGSLVVTRNGLVLKNGVDFFESQILPGFTMTVAPLAGNNIIAFYSIAANVNAPTKQLQVFTATTSQTVFNLSNFSYGVGTGGLAIYSGGLIQVLGVDYTETSSTQFTFLIPRSLGETIVAVGTGVQPNFAHGTTHNWNGADPVPQIIGSGTSFPVTGLTSQAFFRTDLQAFGIFNGLTWVLTGYGSLSKYDIVPSGTINGVNLTFTLADQFTTNTLRVFRNGLALQRGVDFFESQTMPGFTLTVPPNSGNVLITNYQVAVNVNAPTKQVQAFTATAGQTLFTLTNSSYIVGSGGLEVYSAGLRQILTTDYTELTTTSFGFTTGREVGELVIAVTQGILPNFSHGSTHQTSGVDPIILTGTSFPAYSAGQHIGDLFYRTDLQALSMYNGTTWSIIQGAGDFRKENVAPTGTTNGLNLTFLIPDNNFTPGTLVVTRNGLVLKNGVDFFESQSLPGFTVTDAPITGSTLLAFYRLPSVFLPTTAGEFQRVNIVPSGTIDGSNLTFTFTENFIAGTVEIWRNGMKLQNGVDFTEQQSLPGFNTVVATTLSSTLIANYRVTNGTTGPTVQRQTIVSTLNQLTFSLNFSYTPGSSGLQVFSGGLLMSLTNDYTEFNNTSVLFNTGRALNENVSFVSTGIVPNFGHGSTHKQGAKDPITHATRTILSGSPVAISRSDYYVFVNKTSGSATILNLPSGAQTGDTYEIKDAKGDAGANPIYVVPASGTIDGLTQFVINSNRGAAKFYHSGQEYVVF
jgi:hypothetical protein